MVEDNRDILDLFEEILVIAGYQVDTCETFQAAANLLALREYNLLVTDGRLPDGTGMTLADKAKEKGIATLIVTGFLHALHRGDPGIEDHYTILQKPLTPKDLLAAVGAANCGGKSRIGATPAVPAQNAAMVPLDATSLTDLDPDDVPHIECACGQPLAV